MLQRALKIETQQWPIFSISILISRSIIYSVMKIVMNIQQWKDINNWPSTFVRILNTRLKIVRILDKTGNGLTHRAVPQLKLELSETTLNELMTKPEWTRHTFLFHFVYKAKKLCRNFDIFNAELPWVWLEKMTSVLRKILFSSGIELCCRRGTEKLIDCHSYRLYHYDIYKHWDVLQ